MGTWICHLRLAENLLDRIEGLDPGQFAVGSIAPDSGIPDENWENYNPPKSVSHFASLNGNPWRLADLDFYHRYLADILPDANPARFSFLLGYFLHLVTDNLWRDEIWASTDAKWGDDFAERQIFITEVKRDWYGLDFVYVRDHRDSLFWKVFLRCQYDRDAGALDFMPPEAVMERIEYIQTFYQRTDERVQTACARPFIYLPKTRMDRFVAEATETLHRVYRHIWENKGALGEAKTVLDV